MKIYGDLNSGNCLKVKWTANRLALPYEWIDVNTLQGESRTAEFLAMSPMGKVPVVLLDDDRPLAQSNAIISYLATGTTLLPNDPFSRAKVNELMFWEQHSHEPFVAECRFHMFYLGKSIEEREPWRVERGEQALDLMERLVSGKDWFVGDTFTIADIALVAYTRVAHEGGFDLSSRSNVRGWISRCENELKLEAV